MSVQNETYLLVGVKLNGYEYGDLSFPWCGINAKGTFGVLDDCFNDSYCIAGYCVSVASDDGFELTEINSSLLIESYSDKVFEWLNDHDLIKLVDDNDKQCRVLIITHYH